MGYEIRCHKCLREMHLDDVNSFDLISTPTGKEVALQRYGIGDATMYLVPLCDPCYKEAMTWTESRSPLSVDTK